MLNKLLYILLATSIHAAANRYLPEFSGYWYTAAHYLEQDACYQSSYDYDNWTKGSAENVAAKILSDVPIHPDCQWGKVFLKDLNYDRPADFVSSNQDWQSIVELRSAITGQRWQRDCRDDQGQPIDSRTISIWPHYVCPSGSHFAQGMQWPLCTDDTHSCHADIVARDLMDPPILAKTGYVALISMGRGIASALAAHAYPDAILQQPLTDFKKITPFWGEKFGLPQTPSLTLLDATSIIQAIKSQQELGFNYTLGWQWHPGYRASHPVYDEISKQWFNIYGVNEKALFRNDSLVYYAYLQGAQTKILADGFQFGVLPVDLYHAFLYSRFTEQKNPLMITVYFNALAFDEIALQKILETPNVPRLEKLTTLLNLSKDYQNSSLIFEYLIDTLFEYKPIELTAALINLYQQQTVIDNKYRLLARLDELINLIADEPESQRTADIPNVVMIQHLYDHILSTETNPLLLKMAMQKYPLFTAPDKAKANIELAFQRIEQERLKVNFTTAEFSALRLQLTFATQQTQARDLPELLTNPEGSGKLPYQVCTWLQTMPTTQVNASLKPSLKNYLLKYQRLIIDPRDLQAPYPACNWLSAYATVSIDKDSEKTDFMLQTIHDTKDPISQARYLSQQPVDLLAKMKADYLHAYQAQFNQLLTLPILSDADRQLVKTALSHLTAAQAINHTR